MAARHGESTAHTSSPPPKSAGKAAEDDGAEVPTAQPSHREGEDSPELPLHAISHLGREPIAALVGTPSPPCRQAPRRPKNGRRAPTPGEEVGGGGSMRCGGRVGEKEKKRGGRQKELLERVGSASFLFSLN
jgi:hypothetical protein